MPIQTNNASEPIPGYRVRKRIGAGGYGEVWIADAPGGLQKAIKFVYGYLDEDRANRELKSLNRIRGVRHPFLLSLERIEVVEGQLLIVTELADTSLKARYEECRQAGMQGIPRDELLVYIKDTAEALDYMSEQHSLQHLDVKPENLLLLSGRIKVADFGLVKDIGERSISMMGGLTPLYASPEVYDGLPSRFSDQYSLAIVYQEMLTGQLPFTGNSAAQLAMQHATADPSLESLSPIERSILARALDKTPTRRYGSCRELVERLVKGDAPEAVAPAIHITTAGDAPVARVAPLEAEAERLLGPVELSVVTDTCQPTLFLGLGGVAGNVLRMLKGRLAHRFGGADTPFSMLAVDTDAKALAQLQHDISYATFEANEVVHLPLQRPENYRSQSGELLKWLSRRWLYNIPRSLQPEGRRPLGRLALVDNAQRLYSAIHAAAQRARDPEGIAAAEQASGLKFAPGLRVVIVASPSGATGGGMALDVAYASRQILTGLGLGEARVIGLLPHLMGGSRMQRELGAVNAYAFLEEWYHYSRRGYPGDKSCGLQPVTAKSPPFDDAYLVHLGDSQGVAELDEACRSLANYLFIDAVTQAGEFFRQCRSGGEEQPAPGARVLLRTFGISRVGMEEDDWMEAAAEQLAKAMAEYWKGRDPDPLDTNSVLFRQISVGAAMEKREEFDPRRLRELDTLAKDRCHKLALDVDAIRVAATRLIEAELGHGTLLEFLRRVIRESHAFEGDTWQAERLFSALRVAFGDAVCLGKGAREPAPLEAQLSLRLKALADACGEKAGSWVRRAVELTPVRINGARWLARSIVKHLQGMEESCAESIVGYQHELRDLEHLLQHGPPQPEKSKRPAPPYIPSEQEVLQYAHLRLLAMIDRCVGRFAQFVVPFLEEADTDLLHLLKAWEATGSRFESAAERVRGGSDAARSALAHLVGHGIDKLDAVSRAELIRLAGRQRIYDAMERVVSDPDAAAAGLRRCARRLLLDELQNSDVACFPKSGQTPRASRVTHALARSVPVLRGCGGEQRLLALIPNGSSVETARRFFDKNCEQAPTLLPNDSDDVVLCHEVGGINLLRAANLLVEGNPQHIQCAAHVRTRTDVDWSNLTDSRG